MNPSPVAPFDTGTHLDYCSLDLMDKDTSNQDSGKRGSRPLLPVPEILERLGGVVPRTSLYRQIRQGSIPSVHVGRRVYVPARWLEEKLNR